jgi:hypothetical protein
MGQTLQGIVDFAAPVVLTATGHPELAAAYSGASSYAKTGDPLAALASAGTQYAGNQFFGKAGQLGAPSATDPLVAGFNAGTQLANAGLNLATDIGEQAGIANLEAIKNNAMANAINPAMGSSFGDTVRTASDAAAKDAFLNSGNSLFDTKSMFPLTGGSVADAASSPILTPYQYAPQVNPLAPAAPGAASLTPTKVPFESLSMGDKLGSFGRGLESLTSSAGRQDLMNAYGGSGLKAGLGAAAFASPLVMPLLTPEPMQAEEASYYNGPIESLESVRQRARGYAEGGITDLGMAGGGAFDARTKLPAYDEPTEVYAKGGYLDGPGDGMSDSIPATIANKQPARLADGEFVVPADVVSHLGNGSTKAGAQRLYSMMDKVRKARTGTTKQGRQINPNKYMPA